MDTFPRSIYPYREVGCFGFMIYFRIDIRYTDYVIHPELWTGTNAPRHPESLYR